MWAAIVFNDRVISGRGTKKENFAGSSLALLRFEKFGDRWLRRGPLGTADPIFDWKFWNFIAPLVP
jgi:hypothetical protein